MAGDLRIVGHGVVSLGGALSDWASYEITVDGALDEVANATVGYTQRVHKGLAWSAKVDFELAQVGRSLTPMLSVGSWNGAELSEYSLKFSGKLADSQGGADDTVYTHVLKYDWSLDATKWEAADSYQIFQELLLAQGDSPYASVLATTPFGDGNGLVEKNVFSRNRTAVGDEKLTLQGAGAWTNALSADPLVAMLLTSVSSSVSDGYAVPLEFSVPEGGGNCHIESLEYGVKMAEKVTRSISVKGSGAWSPEGS